MMDDSRHDPAPDLRSDTDVPGDIRYDPDLAVHEPAVAVEDVTPPSRRRSPLLFFALGIGGLAVAVYVVFGLIANESRAPRDYLDEIRLRGVDAWEPAFQLSRQLAGKDVSRIDPRFAPDLIAAFESSRESGADPRVRRYLALSLGELRDARAMPALLQALADSDAQTAIYSVWALGRIGDPGAAPGLVPLLDHEDPGLRKIAAYALGALDAPGSIAPLRRLLHDPVEDVAWNAALSLARRGDPSGVPLLARMLDRAYLDGVRRPDATGVPRELSEEQKEEIIGNALRSFVLLRDASRLDAVRLLRDSDPSLRIRQAALETLAALERSGPR